MLNKFMKAAKVKSEEEFLAKYPSEEAFFKAFPKFKNGGNIPKAKGGMKVTSERWDPQSQMWVLDEGMPAKQIQPQKVQPFSMMENPYAGVFNQDQSDNTFFKPYNQVHYDGILTPNYMRTEFNPQTNKWDKVNQVDMVELQPQYTGDWSNAQRKSFEAQQPSQIGAYKTTKGKRKSRYNTEYDDMFKNGGQIPKYFTGGELEAISGGSGNLSLPVDTMDPSSIDPQLIGNQSHGVSQMDLQAIENPNQVNQIQQQQRNDLNTRSYNESKPDMKKVSTGVNRFADIMNNIESGLRSATKNVIMGGNALAMNLLGNTQRDERLDRPYQKPVSNQFAYGTGSQAIAKNGMSIPYENGGTLDNTTIHNGGNAELISYNPYTPETIQYNGQSHDNGGITIDYNGSPVEVEGGETQTGNIVFGNMKIPGTKTKFKEASKQLAKEERKASKVLSKGQELLSIEPLTSYQALKVNSGKILTELADKKLQEAAKTKQELALIQDAMLKGKEQSNKMKNGGLILIAEDGINIDDYTPLTPEERKNEKVIESLRKAALQVGINPDIYERLSYQESGFRPGVAGPKTKYGQAFGHVQMLPSTAKQYGLTSAQLKSNKQEDIDAVSLAGAKHFKSLLDENNGDYDYALMAYNAGSGGLNTIKKMAAKDLGKSVEELTGREVALALQDRQIDKPSSNNNLYQNQTADYVNNIMLADDKSFYGDRYGIATKFNDKYYQNKDVSRINSNDGSFDTKGLVDFNPTAPSPSDYQLVGDQSTPNKYDSPEYRVQLIENQKQANQILPWQTKQINSQSLTTEQPVKKLPSLADSNKLSFGEIAPEVGTLLSNIQGADFVQGQEYNPTLYTPYQVSFQDRINENNAQLKAMERMVPNNPSALSALAAQAYQANNAILADQFRTNQGITNDVINKNVSIINDAETRNLALRDQQYVRQAQAEANTRQQIYDAMSSISNKYSKNKKENIDIRLKETMFPNYRPSGDGKYEMEFNGEKWVFDPTAQTMTPLSKKKQEVTEVDEEGNKKTKTTYEKSNNMVTKKWGGWI